MKKKNPKDIKEKILKSFIKIIIVLIALILIFLFISAITKTGYFNNTYDVYGEKVEYESDNIIINIILIIIGILIIYGGYKLLTKVKSKYILIVIIALYVILSIIWIVISKAPLRADQKLVNLYAKEFLENNFYSLFQGGYLFTHPMQLPIVYFIEFIYSIFGQHEIVIRIINVICSATTLIFIYKISKLIFKTEESQKILMLLISGSVFMIFLNTLIYGNVIGLMLAIIAVYYTLKFLEKKKIKYLILITITITLAILIKSNYQIYMIGIVVLLVLDLLKKVEIKNIILVISVIVLPMLLNTGICKITENITKKEIPRRSSNDIIYMDGNGKTFR